MTRLNAMHLCGVLALALLTLTAGCPMTPTDVPGPMELSTTEGESTKTAVDSAENVAQVVAPVPSIALNTIVAPTGKASNRLEFGTCPVTTLTGGSTGTGSTLELNFNLSSDFSAEGCAPEGEGSFTCSGVLESTLEFISKTLTFTFGGITCAGQALDGTAELLFAFESGSKISADGTMNVDATKDSEKTNIDGTVASSYDLTAKQTTIESFVGVVSDGTTQRDCTMTNCVVDFKVGQNFIPISGTMVLTGGDRKVTITFDANSPTTGNVQVSVNDGPTFTVNVFNL